MYGIFEWKSPPGLMPAGFTTPDVLFNQTDKTIDHKGERMATQTKPKSKDVKRGLTAGSLVWFEIPADNPERAKKFYGSLFGWRIKKFEGTDDYWHIDTGGGDDTPDGGLMARKHSEQPITNYVNVKSVNESMAKVEQLGGTICKSKTAVPQMGYFAICQDTENNMFALWESNDRAK